MMYAEADVHMGEGGEGEVSQMQTRGRGLKITSFLWTSLMDGRSL